MISSSKHTESKSAPVVGRFAPSPTGYIHAGNIYASLMAWLVAKSQGGEIVLRIEDLDRERSKPEYAEQLMRDYESLGLTWDRGPFYQHDRDDIYQDAFCKLKDKGLVYPCYCTRADLKAASAPHAGEHRIYPGTCRNLSEEERAKKEKLRTPSWRLIVPNDPVLFTDLFYGEFSQNLQTECGDVLIKRSDGAFAYQLAVVIDDAEQGVNSIVRGVDLIESCPRQRYLQDMLGLPHVEYAHHPLLCAKDGRRLSKRNKDAEMAQLLSIYKSPAMVIGAIATAVGLIDEMQPVTPAELLPSFDIGTYGKKLDSIGHIAVTWS